MDVKPNKLNFVSTARFQEISERIKRSIELLTQSTFKFSEPTSVHSPSVQNSIASARFEFREPLEKGNDDRDTLQEFSELLSLLNIGQRDPSNSNLDGSIEEGVANNVILNDGNDVSTDRVTNLDVSTNEQTSPPMVGRQTCVDGSMGIDTNTQITHLDLDTNEQNHPPLKRQDNQPLPFLIKHIQRITWPDQQKIPFVPVMQLFGQTFETVMVYGTVTSLNVGNGGLSQRFVIDDGSGSVSVVWRASKQIIELIRNIHNLDVELKSCRNSDLSVLNENWQPNSEDCKKVLESFNQIVHIIKRGLTKRTKLKLFRCAAVVGKPLRRPGTDNVTLYSSVVEDDSGGDRGLELYYKKYLIRLYEEKTLKRTGFFNEDNPAKAPGNRKSACDFPNVAENSLFTKKINIACNNFYSTQCASREHTYLWDYDGKWIYGIGASRLKLECDIIAKNCATAIFLVASCFVDHRWIENLLRNKS